MPRIFLAEGDGFSARAPGGDALERAGYEVTACAVDGEEAVAVLDEIWDLFLTDIVMPGLDGIEVARQVRRPGIRDCASCSSPASRPSR